MLKKILMIMFLVFTVQFSFGQALEVHEWGTFTVVQNDLGETLVGVNTDDEPLPPFVYQRYGRINKIDFKLVEGAFSKGLPRFINRKMRIRLETPVVYFYPREDLGGKSFDFHAEFKGGIISEVYPKTFEFQKDGIRLEAPLSQAIWKSIILTTKESVPKTDNPVWLEPRKVNATAVQVEEESEKYLFYRGLGERDIPLHVVTNRETKKIEIYTEEKDPLSEMAKFKISDLWYVNVDTNGKIMFKSLKGFDIDSNDRAKKIEFSSEFTTKEKKNDYQALFTSMKESLVSQGLYVEEASAMLKTWEHAYFKQPGSRIFYMVPRGWVDKILPIKVSIDSKIERAMIGRIEIISSEQYAILQELKNAKVDSKQVNAFKFKMAKSDPKVSAGKELDPTIHKFFENYKNLGRFRDAIINDSHKNKANANLSILLGYLFEG